MPDNNELVNMLRSVIQEELKPIDSRLNTMERGLKDVRQELQQVNTRLGTLESGQADLKKGQAAIEATVNDLKAINRGTHKKIFTQLDALWDDIKIIGNQLDKKEDKIAR